MTKTIYHVHVRAGAPLDEGVQFYVDAPDRPEACDYGLRNYAVFPEHPMQVTVTPIAVASHRDWAKGEAEHREQAKKERQPRKLKKERQPRKLKPQADGITRAEAMELTGLNRQAVGNRVNRGVFAKAGYGIIDRQSVQDWLDAGGLDGEPGRGTARKAVAKAQQKPHKQDRPGKDEGGEDFVRIEHLAKSLGITEEEVARLKKIGEVEGGYGWVERNAFMRVRAVELSREQ